MTTAFVRIKAGAYRSTDVAGMAFQLVEQFKVTAKGGYVTVKNGGKFPGFPEDIRVKVDSATKYEFISEQEFLDAGNLPVAVEAVTELAERTDEEIIAEIRERFDILNEMTQAAVQGDIRAMIVSGPPGVGKSHGVEQIVEKAVLFDKISGSRLRAEVVTGSVSGPALYQLLYKYSDKNCMIVFDDCDSVFFDEESLGLLKGALNSGKNRKISWLKESQFLRSEGIPTSFQFNGSVVFLTNIKFDSVKGKLKEHVDALQSRCHYLDLEMATVRERLLRIKQVFDDGRQEGVGLFQDYNFTEVEEDEILDFMKENQAQLREISLRMAVKIADLRRSFPLKWKATAKTTCMKKA